MHNNFIKKNEIKTESENILSKEEELLLVKILINNNKDKPPTFHIDNLRANKITFNNNRIIRFFYSLQEEKYHLEKNFLYKIQDEFIYLDDNQLEENKYQICPKQLILKDPIKKYYDHLIFLTTIFQLKLLSESDIIFVDGHLNHAIKILNK